MAFQIEWIASRFFDPGKIANEMIIIHHTGSTNGVISSFEGTINWFKPAVWRNDNQVSSHYLIALEERPIVQMVHDEDTAWHAGDSQWTINGVVQTTLNTRSIGIELQGDGNIQPYSDFQYDALIWLLRTKMSKFNIPSDLVRGHQEITPRKRDPGQYFDWNRVRRGISSTSIPVPNKPDGGIVDEDGDGVVYIDNDHSINNSNSGDDSLIVKLFKAIFSIFKSK
jgi:N-acetyl-anhydromuramyl-L-alanine amidase AmpD